MSDEIGVLSEDMQNILWIYTKKNINSSPWIHVVLPRDWETNTNTSCIQGWPHEHATWAVTQCPVLTWVLLVFMFCVTVLKFWWHFHQDVLIYKLCKLLTSAISSSYFITMGKVFWETLEHIVWDDLFNILMWWIGET